MAAKKKQRKKEPISLPQEEWDFEECPPNKIWDCWLFEFSREYVRQGNTLPYALRDFLTPDEQFPETPYLRLPSESKRREEEPALPAIEEAGELEHFLNVWGDYNTIHATKGDPNWDDIWTIRIDWTLPPKKLAENFRLWTLDARPSHRTPNENRGTNPRDTRRSQLKKLGAYRLLETGISPVKAMEYSVGITGRAPYADEKGWYDAKVVVPEILSGWPPDYLR